VYQPGVLMFPDAGPTFMRTLRTAALYCGEIHSLSLFNGEIAARMLEAFDADQDGQWETQPLVRKIVDYFRFIREEEETLRLAVSEGVLKPILPFDPVLGSDAVNDAYRGQGLETLGRILSPDASNKVQRQTLKKMDKILELVDDDSLHYGYIHAVLGAIFKVVVGKEEASLVSSRDEGAWEALSKISYLLLVASVAEVRGVVPLSWDQQWLKALWELRSLVSLSGAVEITPILGQRILERNLPAVDSLPLASILDMRFERSSEIEAFRVGIASLSARVDVSQPMADVEREIGALIASEVDPAVRDLSAAVTSSRNRTLAKLGRPAQYGAGLVTASLAFAAGAPLNVSAALAATGALIGTALEGHVERENLKRTSQWGLLYRLREMDRGRF
jgi:hypothetical protein